MVNKLKITLFLPKALSHPYPSEIKAPALQTLLSRATVNRRGPDSVEGALKTLFQGLVPGAVPAGALGAGLRGEGVPNGFWCRADPVITSVDHKTAYILGNEGLDLSLDETRQLIGELNAHLDQDGIRLQALNTREWVCSVVNHTDVVMNDLCEIIGKNLKPLLPSGPDQDYWRRLMTECQMILMSSKVNEQRMKLNQPLVSSLWFWGLGKWPKGIKTEFDEIYANDTVVKGLAQSAKVAHYDLRQVFDEKIMQGKNVLVVDKSEDLGLCEDKWFAPLLRSLKAGNIQELKLLFANGIKYTVAKKHLKYFWRSFFAKEIPPLALLATPFTKWVKRFLRERSEQTPPL